MSKCGKCKSDVVTSEAAARCTGCNAMFHPSCTKSGVLPTKAKLRTWKCESCKDETSSVSSVEAGTEDKQWFLEALNKLRVDINSNTDEKFSAVQNQLSVFSEELSAISNRTAALEASQENLQKRCGQLEEEKEQLSVRVRELEEKIQDAEQHSRCSNIEIVGIPVTNKEDIYICLGELAKAIGVPFATQDISMAHRLRLYSSKYTHPPIIAQFTSRRTKEMWLRAARAKGVIDATEIAAGLRPGRVYINEHLTPHNKAVLGKARRLLKAQKIHYAGYFNGKVLVKRKEGDKATRVLNLEDLDQFDQ